MPLPSRRSWQLSIAIAVFAVALAMLGYTNWAADSQYEILRGCWPEKVDFDGLKVTSTFWREQAAELNYGWVKNFFYTRINHRIHLYFIVLCAIIGWSAWTFRRIVTAEDVASPDSARSVPTWGAFISTLLLSLIASGILFVALLQAQTTLSDSWVDCIRRGRSYAAGVAGLAAGMFIVQFFKWFEEQAERLWNLGRKDS